MKISKCALLFASTLFFFGCGGSDSDTGNSGQQPTEPELDGKLPTEGFIFKAISALTDKSYRLNFKGATELDYAVVQSTITPENDTVEFSIHMSSKIFR